MDKNVLNKIENLNITFLEKIIVRIFKKTFCKVYVGPIENLYTSNWLH